MAGRGDGSPGARREVTVSSTALLAGLGLALCAAPALAQAVPAEPSDRTELPRISATWVEAPIADVLLAFSTFSGKSIVRGENATGSVTAEIKDQPWDAALRAILSAQGLIAVEDEYGIIRVSNIEALNTREAVEPIVTRVYRISFSRASELRATIAPLLSPRGSVTAAESTNSLIVSDIARVQRAVARLLGVSTDTSRLRVPRLAPLVHRASSASRTASDNGAF